MHQKETSAIFFAHTFYTQNNMQLSFIHVKSAFWGCQ